MTRNAPQEPQGRRRLRPNYFSQWRGRLGEKKGVESEDAVWKALAHLSMVGIPIFIRRSKKNSSLDRCGVDIEVGGTGILVAHFGINVKSSNTGVASFEAQKARAVSAWHQAMVPYQYYSFLYNHQNPVILYAQLLRFILEKSESHQAFASHVPRYMDEEALQVFIAKHFSKPAH